MKFDQDLCLRTCDMTLRSYFGKRNVVPLAMFQKYLDIIQGVQLHALESFPNLEKFPFEY